MRDIQPKNYLFLAILSAVTVILVIYMGTWYKTTNEYKQNHSPLIGTINNISINELDSYLMENPNSLVYISNYSKELYQYENDLKSIITNYNLESDIIYINLSASDEQKIDDYYQVKEHYITNLVIFENGKIVSFLATTKEDLTKEKTIAFLIEQGVIE